MFVHLGRLEENVVNMLITQFPALRETEKSEGNCVKTLFHESSLQSKYINCILMYIISAIPTPFFMAICYCILYRGKF